MQRSTYALYNSNGLIEIGHKNRMVEIQNDYIQDSHMYHEIPTLIKIKDLDGELKRQYIEWTR